jgi:hypothetical protein
MERRVLQLEVTSMALSDQLVLVPLDGSSTDLAVLALAAAMAVHLQGALVLMRVVRPGMPPLFRQPLSEEQQQKEDAALVAQTARALQEADRELRELEAALTDTQIRRVLLVSANPARRIVDWIGEHPVRLVVAARSARGESERQSSTGIASRIAKSGIAPVLSVGLESERKERAVSHVAVQLRRRRLICAPRGGRLRPRRKTR